ncbi:Holliday junction branch migration protein RuvA [Lactobacillus nasalidis]|uniref:Holliday junction branch migration protein RuvA n=1 Tax=Lactobacillus nasalidis TaxID=2797258 RepID=UPI0019153F64|nr:Holliday junction branch migration protein RuvA [Lactobacillus nasalidis]
MTAVNPAYVVIEVAGIGYRILTPTPYAYHEGDKARIYIEQVVRENGIALYGFKSQQDKGLFNKLNEVSGIGPKSALAIMAAEDNGALASAIESGEVTYLTRFPGIGKKTASQIVLDLRGKMGNYVAENLFSEDEPKPDLSPALEDALLALGALGYSQREVDRIKPKLEKLPEMSADEYIKRGLGLLLKK